MVTNFLGAVTLAGVMLVAANDHVPSLNTVPTCAGAGELSMETTAGSCQRDEQQARDELATKWSKFPAADRRDCVATTEIGGFPSYVQVLTCLEIARDARQQPAE